MTRKTYFAFDYDDVRAANVVRNSNVVRADERNMAFHDHSLYEKVKQNDAAITKAINDGLDGTSVTVICTGAHTWSSRWVRYEIARSLQQGNGLIVVDVDGVGLTPQPTKGPSPLANMGASPRTAHTILGGEIVDIMEWNAAAQKWQVFQKASTFDNIVARYPASFASGNAYRLSDRFSHHYHWNDISIYFETYLNLAAEEVGHRRTAGR